MNTHITKKAITTRIITVSAAAICLSGSWATTPAQATTDASGGGPAVASSVDDIGQIVAVRKMQMAHDYVANAAARTEYAAVIEIDQVVADRKIQMAADYVALAQERIIRSERGSSDLVRIRPHSVSVVRDGGPRRHYRVVAQFCTTSYCRNLGSERVEYGQRAVVSSVGYASGRFHVDATR